MSAIEKALGAQLEELAALRELTFPLGEADYHAMYDQDVHHCWIVQGCELTDPVFRCDNEASAEALAKLLNTVEEQSSAACRQGDGDDK